MPKSSKSQLLEVAGKTFSRHGYYKTSMQQIAQGARKAKASLYYHFENKEELFVAVVDQELAMIKEELTLVLGQDMDTRSLLKQYMLRRLECLNSCINYQETLRPEFYEYYKFVDELKASHFQWEKTQLLKIATSGVEKGELDLPGKLEVYVEVLLMLLKALEHDLYIKKEYIRLQSHLDNLTNVIIKGITKI